MVLESDSPKLEPGKGIVDDLTNIKTVEMDTRDTGKPDYSVRNMGTRGHIPDPRNAIKPDVVETPITDPEPTKAEVRDARKLLIEAQKAERRASEMEKKAKAKLAHADKLAEALEKAKVDPYALADAAGINRADYLDNLINATLPGKNQEQNPLVIEIENLKKQQADYIAETKRAQEESLTAREQEEILSYKKSTIFPMLQADVDKYEALLLIHNGNYASACDEIYSLQSSLYNDEVEQAKLKGENPDNVKVYPLEQVALELDALHNKSLEDGIKMTLKGKRFAKYVAASQTTDSASQDKRDTTAETEYPKTVISKPRLPPADFQPVAKTSKNIKNMSKEEYIASVMKKSDEKRGVVVRK